MCMKRVIAVAGWLCQMIIFERGVVFRSLGVFGVEIEGSVTRVWGLRDGYLRML